MDKKTIVVIGAGPGLGNAVAARFGSEGYRVALVARRKEALEGYVAELAQAGIEAKGYAADVCEIASLDAAISDIQADFGDPDVVVYNVGITTPDEQPLTAADLQRHFATDVVGAYETIERFATDGFAGKGGAVILTGGIAAVSPFPGYLCLALDKAALRNLAIAKNAELAERGIFVGTVMVCGIIGGDDHFAPANIAERFWEMAESRSDVELRYE
ncbi:MAG: SDR family NAD(P)-dependent oxidoreductase [Eggerthellaceae bacterium]|nr:SDR family NAD(P)-dependent oxidoreductase [Eggerthellaceae bacterium]